MSSIKNTTFESELNEELESNREPVFPEAASLGKRHLEIK